MWPFKRKRSQPEISEAMRQQAKQSPGGWVYEIDGRIGDPNGEVPPFAILGAHKVDKNGEITGEFTPNENYDQNKTIAWVSKRDGVEEK